MSEICITSALRTAVGSLGKTLKKLQQEGSEVISKVIKDSKLKNDEVMIL